MDRENSAATEKASVPPVSTEGPSPASEAIRVLIVEDDDPTVFLLRKQLAKSHYHTLPVARSGEEAIAILEDHPADVVVMDIGLQGEIDGIETANQIARSFDLPIIFLSGVTDPVALGRAAQSEAFAYILKPYTERELLVTLEIAVYKHRINRRIKTSEARLSTILANVGSGVISTGPDGRVDFINPAAELWTGSGPEDAVGKPLWEVLDLRDPVTEERVPPLVDLGVPGSFAQLDERRFMVIPRRGEVRYVQIALSPVGGAPGRPAGFVAVLRDFTSQFLAEENLKMMAAALESIEDAVVITDADFEGKDIKILFVNDGFVRLSGWSKEEAIGRSLQIINGPKTDESFHPLMFTCLREEGSFMGEAVNYDRGGKEIQTEWNVTPVDPGSDVRSQFVYVIRDVTEMRRLEENIRQSQKIEAVGQLAGGIAHDFNNLLSVINSYADLLTLKTERDSPLAEYVQNIRTAGQKGADLVSQLMTFSRREVVGPTVVNLAEVARDLEGMLRRLIRENIELVTRFDLSCDPVKAAKGQIEQILVNLCVNARDAMCEGGRITIGTDPANLNDGLLAGGQAVPPGRYTRLSVQDDGSGMDEDTVNRIFEPFFTTKDVGKGTGLGLSTVYGIIKQLGGGIVVDSTPGAGTRFDLYLPAVSGAEEAGEEEPAQAPEGDLSEGSETILVVEDDQIFADCISGLLRLKGYSVRVAGDGLQALDEWGADAADIRLLITDMILPKMSGREIATRMLELNPEMKVVFMTGYDDELDSFYSFPDDSVILEKPFSLNTLLPKVRELLDLAPEAGGAAAAAGAGGAKAAARGGD